MTSREQFEAQIRLHTDESEIEDRLEKANGGLNYAHPETDVAWIWWQASREAVEVNPPKFVDSREALSKGFTVDYSKGFGDGMDAYEESIRAAGIKITEGERKNG
ncbi:hypothetical protein [Hafnia alvei]|uniref:hypothetical protein n=1 Tax=Hafnia alvei TaxID=569 RepID=UPI00396C3AD2